MRRAPHLGLTVTLLVVARLFSACHAAQDIMVIAEEETNVPNRTSLERTVEGSAPSKALSKTEGIMLRLGNHTLDSRTAFKVPGFSSPKPYEASTVTVTEATETYAAVSVAVVTVVSTSPLPTRKSKFSMHHRHPSERRHGPQFEQEAGTRVTAQRGDTAHLDCKVSLLLDKTVSWMRRGTDGELELLTVGPHAYSADERYAVERRYPGNWRLRVANVSIADEGTYECQISTHPPRSSRVYLHVNNPLVHIVDESGVPLTEQYYEAQSTLSLRCLARHVDSPALVSWLHEGRSLAEDTTRGGISVRTEQRTRGADSTLLLARVTAGDAGNYTCAVRGARASTVAVHVLNESLAELHQGGTVSQHPSTGLTFLLLFLALATYFSQSSKIRQKHI